MFMDFLIGKLSSYTWEKLIVMYDHFNELLDLIY